MCAHYKIPQSLGALQALIAAPSEGDNPPGSPAAAAGGSVPVEPDEERGARPTDLVPVILRDPDSGEIVTKQMRFGLQPPWLKDGSGASTFNARSESLHEKPVFREAYRHRRCILPMQTFFEGKQPNKVQISLIDGSVMGMAGLWETKPSPNGPILTCCLITCEPNELIAPIHGRMPVLLPPEEWREWLNPVLQEPRELIGFLRPYPAELMIVAKAEPFKKQRHKSDEDDQGSLF